MEKAISYFGKLDPAEIINDILFEDSYHTVPHTTYALEGYICYLVAQGDMNGFQELLARSKEMDLSFTTGNLSPDPLRQMQYTTVASVTLICRTAIAGGMNEAVAYELSDRIIQKADAQKTPEEVTNVLLDGVRDYICAVQNLRTAQTENPYIRQVVNFIDEHIYDKLSLELIAGELSLNKSYLSKLFKKEMGQTLTDYIYAQKIKQAKRLLLEGKYEFGQIGTFLGFPSQSYFIQIFKRTTGTTPKRWLLGNSSKNTPV